MSYKMIKSERRGARIIKAIKILIISLVIVAAFAIALMLSSCTPPPIPVRAKPVPTALPPNLVMGQDLPTSTAAHRATDTQRPEPTPMRCTVATGYDYGTVNVRSGPGMSYSVVDVAQEGQVLPLFGDPVDGWQRVTTPALVDGWFYVERWCK